MNPANENTSNNHLADKNIEMPRRQKTNTIKVDVNSSPPEVHSTTSTSSLLSTSSSYTTLNNGIPLTRHHREPAPFSHEPFARTVLKACDYSQKISLKDAKAGLVNRPVRVYADGVYDMFHSGHARQLMQACMAFPNTYLIVGVCSDADTHARKGKTVMNESERYEAVRHCRYVDEVLQAAPWTYDMEFFKQHKIDFVAHDDIPYASEEGHDAYKIFKDADMFLTTQRAEFISTTDVIGRILKDYDMYLRRNIRRGLSRKELNISYVKEKQLKIGENIQTIVEKGSHLLHDLGDKRKRIADQVEDLFQDATNTFLSFFGNRGKLQHWWTEATSAIKNAVSPPESCSENEAFFDEDRDIGLRPTKIARKHSRYAESLSDCPESSHESNEARNRVRRVRKRHV